MNKLYLLEWYLPFEEQKKQVLLSDFDEAENRYYELAEALSAGWVSLEELVEKNPSNGFEIEETIHYKEVNDLDRLKELLK